jgi:hypothetical protein
MIIFIMTPMIHLFFQIQLTYFYEIALHCHFWNMVGRLFYLKSFLFALLQFRACTCRRSYIFCFWMNFQYYLVQAFFLKSLDYYIFLLCHFKCLFVYTIFTLMHFHFELNYAYIYLESLNWHCNYFEYFRGCKFFNIDYFLLLFLILLQYIIHCSE